MTPPAGSGGLRGDAGELQRRACWRRPCGRRSGGGTPGGRGRTCRPSPPSAACRRRCGRGPSRRRASSGRAAACGRTPEAGGRTRPRPWRPSAPRATSRCPPPRKWTWLSWNPGTTRRPFEVDDPRLRADERLAPRRPCRPRRCGRARRRWPRPPGWSRSTVQTLPSTRTRSAARAGSSAVGVMARASSRVFMASTTSRTRPGPRPSASSVTLWPTPSATDDLELVLRPGLLVGGLGRLDGDPSPLDRAVRVQRAVGDEQRPAGEEPAACSGSRTRRGCRG